MIKDFLVAPNENGEWSIIIEGEEENTVINGKLDDVCEIENILRGLINSYEDAIAKAEQKMTAYRETLICARKMHQACYVDYCIKALKDNCKRR